MLSRALEGGLRQKVRIAATIPSYAVDGPQSFHRWLDADLKALDASALDVCLIGRLTRENWPALKDHGVLEAAETALADGRIGCFGFSFHDHFHILKGILDGWDKWSVCQIQYSYLDTTHDPGTSGLKLAAERGLAVVVVEPLKSGRLTRGLPPAVTDLWSRFGKGRTPVDWALGFVWNHPEVSTVVCDMSTMEQVVEDMALADIAAPDSLTVQDELFLNRVRDAYRTLRPINCPSCRACMPCPLGIDVPRIFEIYNDAFVYSDVEIARALYRDERHGLGACKKCRLCEKKCARTLPLLQWIEKALPLLGGDK